MKTSPDKSIKDFTEKQKKAFKACMKTISSGQDYTASKSELFKAIRSSECYSRRQDCRKVLRMILKNSNTPLEVVSGQEKVERTDISEDEG